MRNMGQTSRIEIKVTAEEKAAWERAAGVAGSNLSEWIRLVCDRASGLLERRMRLAAKRTKAKTP